MKHGDVCTSVSSNAIDASSLVACGGGLKAQVRQGTREGNVFVLFCS